MSFLQSVFKIETGALLLLSISTKDFVKTALAVEFTRNSKESVILFRSVKYERVNRCNINDVRWFKKATPRHPSKLLSGLYVLKICSSNFQVFRLEAREIAPTT